VTDTLIATKLHIPPTRLTLVRRQRLIEQISNGLQLKLTLISAPAGFGKTTLAAFSIANCGLETAWLSLDKDDNQVERFLSYLVAAFHSVDTAIGSDAEKSLSSADQTSPEVILTSLINDLQTDNSIEIALVLDDYQFISNQAVHEAVSFLLEHCPRTLHVVIATRSDPPLPLARMRARGESVELRAADLRFTESETTQFLNDVMALDLDTGSVAILEKRTEGWIAGLQMAALSMRNRKDVASFIKSFSGTNRYILDYLLEEVLANQSPEVQRFLLNTSILERLTGPLCDAVLAEEAENEDAKLDDDDRLPLLKSDLSSPSASILTYLEEANLFLVPLDDERIWYRYHHLFADLLRARVQQSLNDDQFIELHTRAAQWYERNRLPYEAIYHAAVISDSEWVERLIEQNYMDIFQRRDSASIRFWTGGLTRELLYERPQLCIYEAMSRSWLGQLDEAERLLNEAEKRIDAEASAPGIRATLGHLAYVRSRVVAMRGDFHQAIELCLVAREKTPASNQALLGGIGVMLGYGYFLAGDFTNAIQVLSETIQSGKTSGAVNTTVGAYCVLARLYALRGQLQKPYDLYQEAGNFIHEADSQSRGAISIVDVGIADVLYERNDLETALVYMEKGLALISAWGKVDDAALAYTTFSRIQQALGDISAAEKSIETGAQLIHSNGVFPEAHDAVSAAEVRLWLAQGNSLAVNRWSDSFEIDYAPADSFRFENELENITLVRVCIAQGKLDEAVRLLSSLDASAQAGGRSGRRIEILTLQALALHKSGDLTQALVVLEKSLALAESEQYIRVYLDNGQPMRLLLTEWLLRAGEGPLRDYVDFLLSQFEAESNRGRVAQTENSPADDSLARSEQALVEPLSPRELEVLHLMALGLTNKKIAEQLIVAPGTIKAHAASIYRKLEVANRTEAVARARQLDILS